MTPEQSAYAHEVADWAVPGRPGYDQGEWIYIKDKREWAVERDEPPLVPIQKIREGSCGTDACIAGKVAIDRAPAGTLVFDGETLRFPDGSEEHISDFAARELGIDENQASSIFYSDVDFASPRLHYLADHPNATPAELRREVPSFL